MIRNALIVGLTVALLGINASAVQAQKPGDGCSLLQGAEVQALAGSAKAGTGKPSTDPLGSRLCHYEWGTGNNVQADGHISMSASRRYQRLSLARTHRCCDRGCSRKRAHPTPR